MSENTKKEEYWICKDLACNHKIAWGWRGAVTFAEGFVMFESMQAVDDRRYNLIPKHLSQAAVKGGLEILKNMICDLLDIQDLFQN